jgi:hypothetical protein
MAYQALVFDPAIEGIQVEVAGDMFSDFARSCIDRAFETCQSPKLQQSEPL